MNDPNNEAAGVLAGDCFTGTGVVSLACEEEEEEVPFAWEEGVVAFAWEEGVVVHFACEEEEEGVLFACEEDEVVVVVAEDAGEV